MSRLGTNACSGSSTRASWPTTRRSLFGLHVPFTFERTASRLGGGGGAAATTSSARAPAPRPSLRPCRAKQNSDDDGLDIVERAVAFLFGKKALEDENPMGLKRINFETLADQKVETERQAQPLPGDDAEVALLRAPLLAGTQLEREPLEKVYDTSRGDAWSPSAFHEATRARGAALVLCETEAGSWCGGYNPLGFLGFGDEYATNGAFLFTWPGGDPRRKGGGGAVKLPKIGGPALAVIDAPNEAVRFGAEGLSAPMKEPDVRAAKSRLGTYYERLPKVLSGGRRSVFLSPDEPDETGRRATLKRVAVYCAKTAPEYRLDGIVWKSDAQPPPPS